MAVTTYARSDALTAEAWARKLFVEVKKGLEIAPLIGTSQDSIIQERTEIKDGGDKITFGLRMQLSGAGVTEGTSLEGNEESLTTYSDSLVVNELLNAVRVKNKGTIDAQRVLFDMRTEAKDGLRDWYADRMSLSFFVQACGYTGSTMTYRGDTVTMSSIYTGLNSVTAPSTNRKLFSESGVSADESVTSAGTMNIRLLDQMRTRAVLSNPKIRPLMVGGKKKYVVYLHPLQVEDLRTNTSTGQWLDITKAMYDGSKMDNPIYTGALGEYNGIILRENEDVTTGVNSSTAAEVSTVRRAVLLGAQACSLAFGKERSKGSPYKWVEDTFDYKRELGVSAQGIWGLKKNIFNSEDFATITMSTYASE